MKNKVLKTIICLGLIISFVGISVIMVNAKYTVTEISSLSNHIISSDTIDMLIFVSPQYNNDQEIISAIKGYINAIKDDNGWNAEIIKITKNTNNYQIIDEIIEDFYQRYGIKACLIVGEDTDTPLAGDSDYLEKPSIVPWYTTGGNESYKITEQGIISKPYKMDICISLLYPTYDEKYLSKKYQIISAFEKFTNNRDHKYTNELTVLESQDINKNSKTIYQNIESESILKYKENPDQKDIEQSLIKNHDMFLIHGHSNPSGTYVNGDQQIWFSTEELDNLETPFFGADGCYVSGWWSNQKDNNHLDTSISATWYGSKIFSSKHINVLALGLLSQNGYQYSVSFIENVIPQLIDGENLAESMIGSYFTGDFVIYGDPSFHFTIE